MTAIDILIRLAIKTVNQEWFTDAVRRVIEDNNRAIRRTPTVPDQANRGFYLDPRGSHETDPFAEQD